MTCLSYADPRLAGVYDPLNPPGEEDEFFIRLAGQKPVSILDVGAGTGRLACVLAGLGHAVTGVEPAPGMLAVARRRCDAGLVRWIEAGAADFSRSGRFDLIVLAGHVFQVFLSDAEVAGVLANLHRHLRPDGRLAFATRNPLVREWETWLPDETREMVDVPDVGPVSVHYDIASTDGELVTFETHFRFPDGTEHMAPHTLRFMERERLENFLTDAGLSMVECLGDFDRRPWSADSPEIVVIARQG